MGSISGLGRSPGEGNENLCRYSCLENSMNRGARWVTVHGVEKNQTWLSVCASTRSWFTMLITAVQQSDLVRFSSVQFSRSVVSNSLRPRGLQHARLPCPYQLLELAHTHVHRISDAIQPSHPLSSPSPPAFNVSQHQGLFQWVYSSHQVAKVLGFQLQYQSFQWTPRTDLL